MVEYCLKSQDWSYKVKSMWSDVWQHAGIHAERTWKRTGGDVTQGVVQLLSSCFFVLWTSHTSSFIYDSES